MFSVLRNRNFFLLWSGQVVSQLGNNFNYIALAWLVLTLTGSTVKMGGIMIAQLLPNAVFGIFFGVFVDRFDRKQLMIFCDVIRGLLVLSLPVVYMIAGISLWYIYIVVFTVSSLSLIFTSAEKALIPQIVEEELLIEANAFQEMTSQFASLIGPVLAGILISILPGMLYILYIDSATFFVSGISILLISLKFRKRDDSEPFTLKLMLKEVRDVIVFIIENRILLVINVTTMAVNFFIYPFFIVFPVYSEKILTAGAQGFGFLMGAFGAGMLIGSLSTTFIKNRIEGRYVIYSGMAVVGVCFLAMSVLNNLWSAMFFSWLMGFVIAPGNAVIIAMIQLKTPELMMGRVFCIMFSIAAMASPLGVGVSSFIIEKEGVISTLIVMGISVMMIALLGLLIYNSFSAKKDISLSD